jgi:hypothetical protein
MSTLLRRGLTALVAVVGVAAALLAVAGLLGVHRDAQADAWLAAHAKTATYDVVEIGETAGDGSAEAVWVKPTDGPLAFVDMTHSDQRVTRTGDTVRARLDERDAPATGTGSPADAVGRSFAADYLAAGWPLLLALAAAGVVLWLVRPRRAQGPRTDRQSAKAASLDRS